jgi:hypothetical protein
MVRITLLAAAAWLVLAAAAGAQVISTAKPAKPGKATRLSFEADATAPPMAGRIPKGLTFTAPAGYRVDFRAVTKRCTQLQAKLDECPAKSKIGKGTLVVEVTQPGQVRNVNVPLSFYLKSKRAVIAVAFLAGTRVVPGRISASRGMVLEFNPLPDPPVFPQVSYRLLSVSVEIGAKRRVVTRTARKKRRRVVRSFLRNPAKCSGSWASSMTFTYSDGTNDVLPAPTACAGR